VLIGLIAQEGLISFTTQDDLDANAIAAYRAFRSARYPLDQAKAAQEYMRANQHFGKILLIP
jgi:NADPH:quinone reductase-like Zn-dependent oxidoreductase